MSTYTQTHRRLTLETPLGKDALMLASFMGTEQMSRPFRYELRMFSEKGSLSARDIIGKQVTFAVLDEKDQPRYFNGFVSRFSYEGPNERLHQYLAEVVPWLWFLGQTTDHRIFQDKSVPDIVAKVFQDLGLKDFEKSQLKGNHPQREYCVQYGETDLNFVSRLMEDEGIFFFFRHEKNKHTLVLADQKGAYEDCPEKEVQFGMQSEERQLPDNLTSWRHTYEFVPGKVATTDYNFETPTADLMAQTTSVINVGDNAKFERYNFPGIYGKKHDGDALARVRMEELEALYDVVAASGRCRTFSPGGKFKIKRHAVAAEEGKGYVITTVAHQADITTTFLTGSDPGDEFYSNHFTCIPDSVTYRTPRTTHAPTMQGVQTAVVTGPAGEEIWPDKNGRVRVQFFWDREGKKDEKSSCWVRVSQAHAGKGWGGIDIPRIGEEVLVSFIDGDPDRPIIVGRVYNAGSMPPYGLPGGKTTSGMKSNTHKGSGYNEFILDDTAGNELIRVHGQHDMQTTIEHDETVHIKHDRTETVDNNESITIGGNRTENVVKNEAVTVLQNRTHTIGQNETLSIGLTRTQTVGVNEAITIGAAQQLAVGATRTVTVGAAETITVGGPQTVTVGAAQTVTVGGDLTESIGGGWTETVGGDFSESIGGNYSETVGKAMTLAVAEDTSIQVGKKFNLVAADEITLQTGDATISMKKDGTIMIKGKDITIDASGELDAKASKNIVLKGQKILAN